MADRGDPGAAADAMVDALAEHPDNAHVLYNTACFEALAGRRDDALAHLGRAVELSPQTREWAAGDSDFDSIRDDPEFPG
jgi:predicted TPR repeat methyltransferase